MLNPTTAPTTAAGYSSLFRQLNWREQHQKPRLKTQLRTTRALGDSAENTNQYAAKKENRRNEIKTTPIITETTPLRGKTHSIQFNSTAAFREYKTNKYRTHCAVGDGEIAKNRNSIGVACITAQALVNNKEENVAVIPKLNSAKAHKTVYIKIW
ncbi:Transcription elongation factor GreA [Candidatus Hodgkinia cicadicola]|nr:Transcription elongation factor GreA [Candidatus Hodgkinia cicadicola]